MREGGMRNLKRFFTAIIVGLFFVSLAAADTLELKSGRVVQGKYLGGTQHILRFEVNGEVQTFSTNDIVALTFTDRKSTRLNSSHANISYAVFCLKKKNILSRLQRMHAAPAVMFDYQWLRSY